MAAVQAQGERDGQVAKTRSALHSALVKEHGFSHHVPYLGSILLLIIQLTDVHPLLPGGDDAQRDIGVDPLAKGEHPSVHAFHGEVNRHVGVVDGNHQVEGVRGAAPHKVSELLVNNILPGEFL